jgi:hypothetical protein
MSDIEINLKLAGAEMLDTAALALDRLGESALIAGIGLTAFDAALTGALAPAQDLNTTIGALPEIATGAFANLVTAAAGASSWGDPIIDKAVQTQVAIQNIGAALQGLTGTLTIAVGFSGATNNASTLPDTNLGSGPR